MSISKVASNIVPNIVAFHGFMGVGADHLPFAEACGLEPNTPDLIGHGRFQCADPTQYKLETQLAYWRERIVKGSILIGYSMGGRLALQFACRYPQHLSGLVLIGATPGISDSKERSKRQRWDHAQAERIRKLGVKGFYNEWQHLPIIATQQRITLDIQRSMKRNRLAQSIEGLSNSMIHFGTGTMPDCWEELPNLTVPTLLMVGEKDGKYRGLARRMMARFPDGLVEYSVIPGAGHCAHLEAPQESAIALKRWLRMVHRINLEK